MKRERNERQKNRPYLRRFSIVIWFYAFVLTLAFAFVIYATDILPLRYFLIIVAILVILLVVYAFFTLSRKTKTKVLIIINVLSLLFMSLEGLTIFKIYDSINFLKENLANNYETHVYDIIVNVDSDYEVIEDIANLTVKTVQDMDDLSLVEEELEKIVSVNFEYEEYVLTLLTEVVEDSDTIILVSSGNYDAMIEYDDDFENSVRILDTISVLVEKEETSVDINVTNESFVIYLSGIDTRSGALPARSLSDVNIIIAVNPTTKNILMVHIPRDYYVQLSGTTGLRDKLTHAGTAGGIELCMSTISDLLGIDIDYYIRLNFNSVINLVDAIGGIEVYSDVDYTFTAYSNAYCTFYPGYNYVDGQCALAFARERKAYETGDSHRGENQEQIIELIIEKITSSATLITNYSSILSALDGTFETNFTMDDITSLIKMQINDLATWTIETYNLDGTGAYLPTYSYPSRNLYVVEPDMETVAEAVNRINEVLNSTQEEVEE